MKTYNYPNKNKWTLLSQRPILNQNDLEQTVNSILQLVKKNKDEALLELTLKYDNVKLNNVKVGPLEITKAISIVSMELKTAIEQAYNNITLFHESQLETESKVIETTTGVKCWRKSVGIDKVGLYIPGGSAPLFSTILMLGIPAKIAGCKDVILCTPANENGNIDPTILYTANLVGITSIYKVGGAQAIAAMGFGTETIPQVYKIFGPGNQYVTKAKELIQQNGIAIDMPAGPSEVLIIADQSGNPEFIAADLLSQAEHGSDSQVILLSNSLKIIDDVKCELIKQLEKLPRKETALGALNNSRLILLKTIYDCIEFSNIYAPEHLIIASNNADKYASKITNAGSVFLGNYSCESAGDYASGTNHTLPTNGFSKNYSGVSVDSFVKKITFQKLSAQGISNIGQSIEIMAEAEGLFAHKNAVTLRLNSIRND